MNGRENAHMVPKVFLSSTFYDLRYVRESIGRFIESYGFTAIISETGNLGYTPYQSLDISCYEAMKVSNMAILVVGGRYGSPVSDETMTDEFFKQYKSVTRKEFESAVQNKVPVYVFIEAPVYYEYETYKKNKQKIEDGTMQMNFAAVDNINIFRFISEIYEVKGIPVWSFVRVEDITDKLKKQWATLFLNYLTAIKDVAIQKELKNPINVIDSSIKQMNIIIEKLAEKLIDDPKESENIKRRQIVENTSMLIANSFEFCVLNKEENIEKYIEFFVSRLYEAIDKDLLINSMSDDIADIVSFDKHFEYDGVIMVFCDSHMCYSLEQIKDASGFKEEIVARLTKPDCLSKMKLI